MARNLNQSAESNAASTESARERPSQTTSIRHSWSRRVLGSLATDSFNIAVAVGLLVAVYWLLGRTFPGGTMGISALLSGLIVMNVVATAYDALFG